LLGAHNRARRSEPNSDGEKFGRFKKSLHRLKKKFKNLTLAKSEFGRPG